MYVSSSDVLTYMFAVLLFSLSMSVSRFGGFNTLISITSVISHFDLFNVGFEGHGYACKTMVRESTGREGK